MKLQRLLPWAIALLLSGCANDQGRPDLPYDSWAIGLGAPSYMEVWVESVDVIDRRGLVFERVHGGTVSYTGNPVGWPKMRGGAGKSISGVDLPEIIFVRWQSLAEPQTYNARINIPLWVREEMVKPREVPDCSRKVPRPMSIEYLEAITIVLAPGAIAKVWLGGGGWNPSKSAVSWARSVRWGLMVESLEVSTIARLAKPRRLISKNSASLMAVGKAMKILLLALSALLLSGCALGNGKPVMPYDAWFLGVLAPNYMEVWVESVDVIDQQGLVFEHLSEGNAAIQPPANGKGKPAGWPKRVGSGAGKHLRGIDLPEFLFVRWQSLAEPQTYHAKVIVPQWVREQMATPVIAVCRFDGKSRTEYRDSVTLGLAPGGIVKAWLTGTCSEPLEIGRFVGEVHKEGPYNGETQGIYAAPLLPASKAYVEKNGIPYGSW